MRKVLILLMAGEGKRFIDENINTPKPFLKTKKSLLYLEILNSFIFFDKIIIISQEKHKEILLQNENNHKFNLDYIFLKIPSLGQADTLLKSEKLLKDDDKIVVAPCDLIIHDDLIYENIFKKEMSVWCFNKDPHLEENPHMYSWVLVNDKNMMVKFSPKKKITHKIYECWALSGYFSFNTAKYMLEQIKKLKLNNIKINNEFYVDSILDLALKNKDQVYIHKLREFKCLGTPNQYRNYLNEINRI